MSDDKIEVGQRRRWNTGYVEVTIVEIRGDQCRLGVEGGPGGWCHIDAILECSTRIDTPAAVKVGDVIRDQGVLDALPGEAVLCWNDSPTGTMLHWKRSECRGPYAPDTLGRVGVRVLTLPESSKAEVCTHPVAVTNGDVSVCEGCGHRWEVELPPPPPRCKPGCTPAAPCCTEGVCPAWHERFISRAMGEQHGISPDLPPARVNVRPALLRPGRVGDEEVAVSLSDEVRVICWAFGQSDTRWNDVHKLADRVAEMESKLAAREACCCSLPLAHAGRCRPGNAELAAFHRAGDPQAKGGAR